MKKWISLLLAALLFTGSAGAVILEPKGVNLEFKLFAGVEAREAVVLCRSLSGHEEADAASRKIKTLSAGNTFLTWEREPGWQNCYYAEGEDPVWVRDYYVIEDPAYYVTDGQTAVYAYESLNAPRVALLGRNEELPILLETEDWCVVSLRGAAGWIRKTAKDREHQRRFEPEMLQSLIGAELTWGEGYAELTDPDMLAQLSDMLTDSRNMGHAVSGCPFGVYLTLTTEDEERITMELASDGCSIYRINGRDYRYGYSHHVSNQQLFALFPGYAGR